MEVINIIILVLTLIISLGVIIFILYITFIGDIFGAPFTKSSHIEIQTMFDLAQIKKGETIIDLGSGDGTILIEAARRGAKGVGIELNPFLVWYSRLRVRRLGYKSKVSIKWGDFNKFLLKDADVVFLYLLPNTIRSLQKKLLRELKVGSRIVTNGTRLKGWIPERKVRNVFLYRNFLSCKIRKIV